MSRYCDPQLQADKNFIYLYNLNQIICIFLQIQCRFLLQVFFFFERTTERLKSAIDAISTLSLYLLLIASDADGCTQYFTIIDTCSSDSALDLNDVTVYIYTGEANKIKCH